MLRLLATHTADNTPICSDCAAKISLVNAQVRDLSVEGLKEHLAMQVENAKYLGNSFRLIHSMPICLKEP